MTSSSCTSTPASEPQRDSAALLAEARAAEQKVLDGFFTYVDAERARAEAQIKRVLAERTHDPRGLVERETAYGTLGDHLVHLSAAEIGLAFGRIDIADAEPETPSPYRPVDNDAEPTTVDRRYIGRIGLSDRKDSYRTLLIDWRAPAARPFYTATTAHPDGVLVRRHLRTTGRRVTSVHDEVLQDFVYAGAEAPEQASTPQVLRGEPGNPLVTSHATHAGDESPLLDALNAARTGHMTDIVETIQHEQDDIIRDQTHGVTVVEGGPGTGKTAVALHRAAYLLYTYRELLAPRGVLVIGPNDTFMDYISRVLPTLGEGGVVLSTIGTLYPGVTATLPSSLLEREVKGSTEMLTILTEHVRSYQRVPKDLTLTVDGFEIPVPAKEIRAARTRARRSKLPHNAAQAVFRRSLLDRVARLAAEEIGKDPLGELSLDIGPEPLEPVSLLSAEDVADIRSDLDRDEDILAALEPLWPILEPTQVLHDLLCSDEAIANAAADYDELTWAGLRRHSGAAGSGQTAAGASGGAGVADTAAGAGVASTSDGGGVASTSSGVAAPDASSGAHQTTADAPGTADQREEPSIEFSVPDIALLDELAEMLGPVPREADESEREWELQLKEAQEALDILQGSVNQDSDREDGFDPEILQAFDVIDAEALAERHRVRDHRTTAQRAAEDRTWAYGHVIIDEAQELSAMEWRMVLRRSPNRWMTLVGDTAQTGNPAGVESWKETLAPLVKQRWHVHHLTVNYRTPADIAQLADQLLPQIAPGRTPARAVRATGAGVRMVHVDGVAWVANLRSVLDELETSLSTSDPEGVRSAVVIVPDTWGNAEADGWSAASSAPGTAADHGIAPSTDGTRTNEDTATDAPEAVTGWQAAPAPREVTLSALQAVATCGERSVRVLPSRDVKGLEFDFVVVMAPDQIVAASPQGYQDLYVSLTRATQGLVVMHDGDPVVRP